MFFWLLFLSGSLFEIIIFFIIIYLLFGNDICPYIMSDQSWDCVGHGPILVGHCPMTDSYLQLCLAQTSSITWSDSSSLKNFNSREVTLSYEFICWYLFFGGPTNPLSQHFIRTTPGLSLRAVAHKTCQGWVCLMGPQCCGWTCQYDHNDQE